MDIQTYPNEIQAAQGDPRRLENLYKEAEQRGETAGFAAAIQAAHTASPENLLFDAWQVRLENARPRRTANWGLAILLSVFLGVVYWLFSDSSQEIASGIPTLFLIWAPVGATAVSAFLMISGKRAIRLPGLLLLGLAVLTGYIILITQGQARDYQRHYLDMMIFHVPVLAYAAVAVGAFGLQPAAHARFAFFHKTIEVIVTGGLYGIAVGIFASIATGMFSALGIDLPEPVLRVFFAGGVGLVPVLAVASVYDPTRPPEDQDFHQGIGQLVTILPRLLLPLTFIVLAVYLLFIPFNFIQPFKNRDVLINYNGMLFAVMALLLGVTPVSRAGLSPNIDRWLRRGVVAVVAATILVSVYALAAILYRTVDFGFTINRVIVIGWNLINTTALGFMLSGLLRKPREAWVETLQQVYSRLSVVYLAWAALVVLLIPLIFR